MVPVTTTQSCQVHRLQVADPAFKGSNIIPCSHQRKQCLCTKPIKKIFSSQLNKNKHEFLKNERTIRSQTFPETSSARCTHLWIWFSLVMVIQDIRKVQACTGWTGINETQGDPLCKVLSGLKTLKCVSDNVGTMKHIKLTVFHS